jgi:thioredoxin-related protein
MEPVISEIVYDEDGSFEFVEISPNPDKRLLHFDKCDCYYCGEVKAQQLIDSHEQIARKLRGNK